MTRFRYISRSALVLAASLLAGCGYWPFGDKAADPLADAEVARAPLIGVEVRGIEGPPADNVRLNLTLGQRSCDTPRAYLAALAAQGEQESAEALRAFGYYHAQITLAIEQGDDCPLAVVDVIPGSRVTVSAIEVKLEGDAATDRGFEKRLRAMPLQIGAALVHSDYASSKTLIESVALERGYLGGRFRRSRLIVDPLAGSARIDLVYAAGPRYTLGEITIVQDPPFIDEQLVRRFLDHVPGEPYDAAIVTRFYKALAANEYFGDVEVRPQLSATVAQTVPVTITLTARPKHKFGAGAGASTDELLRGKLSYTNRRLNRWGHRFDAEARASAIEQSLSSRYQIPRRHPADEWLSLQAGVRREQVDSFKTTETQLGVTETKRRPWDIMETRFLNLNRQVYDVGAADQETSTLLIPGLSWNKVTANDPLYPTRGYSATFEVRGGAEQVVSDTSFLRVMLTTRAAYGLPLDLRALVRADLGGLWVDEFGALPPSERFFAGGDNSIRGYDIDALGPLDAAGQVIGGRYLGVLSLELEKTIVGNWGIAAFVDAGNAFAGEGASTGIKTGVGLGLRWRSPVGPVRVDLAHPLDNSEIVRLHLRIGPDL